ncbi:MAG: hypothetical protein RLZZ519_2754, partial [Bacteroidota bacterium]
MAKFNFYLNRAKNTPEYKRTTKPTLVLLSHLYKGNRYVLSTSIDVAPQNWDFKSKCLKSSATNSASINEALKAFKERVEAILLGMIAKGHVPSPEQLKAEIEAQREQGQRKQEKRQMTLSEAFAAYIEDRRDTYQWTTVRNFNRNKNRIAEYEAATKAKTKVENFGLKEHEALIAYMNSKHNHSKNTNADLTKTIKTVLKWLKDSGDFENYTLPELKVSWEDVDNVYLDQNELAHLWSLDLSKKPSLERVRDLFLVGCWTGLRFSDFVRLRPENVDGKFLKMQTQKTGVVVTLPIHPILREIFEKYDGNLPPKISNQKMNNYLKEIAQLAEFNGLGMDSKTMGGKKKSEWRQKWERISTHTARRSFATNHYKAGFHSGLLM